MTRTGRTGRRRRAPAHPFLAPLALALLIVPPLVSPAEAAFPPRPQPKPAVVTAADQAAFTQWINTFRAEALAHGISGPTFDLAFADVTLNQQVIDASERQPEIERQIWTYLTGAVSEFRIQKGRALMGRHAALLHAVEDTYQVPAQYLVAIWGLESSFGTVMGRTNIIEALATLAFQGRRRAFGKRELLAALTILEKGYARKVELKGSWAGGMGHTQFIPSTYLAHAVDYDGDGRRDLWSSLGDVFASTAHYLSVSGWQAGASWGREVVLPEEFDYALADTAIVKPVSAWQALGVTAAVGTLDPEAGQRASLLLPGGYTGPAFLIYPNFRVLLRYNNATSYALAVAHLADRIMGGPAIQGKWPRHEPALTRADREALQRALAQLGYDPGVVDGIVGARTRAALRLFQRDADLPADGFPSQAVRARLKQAVAK